MFSPLSGCVFTEKWLFLSKQCLETVSTCLRSEKIKTIANGIFKGGTSSYFCAFGIMELFLGIVKKEANETEVITLNKITEVSSHYFNLHGGLMFGCGLLSLADALHDFGIINLGSILNAVSHAANVLFLGTNILALKENIRLFHDLRDTDRTQINIDEKELHLRKQSVFFGIASNIGYIIATASLLYSGATALTILIILFSCFSGGIKILYDLSIWAKSQHLT
jgi:hypothetical protein